MIKPLPGSPADPLHIIPPWLIWLTAALILILLYVVYYRYVKQYADRFAAWVRSFLGRLAGRLRALFSTRPVPATEQPLAVRGMSRKEVEERIDTVRDTYLPRQAYRAGLFELSGVMKTYIERNCGLEVEEMTAEEIAAAFRNREPGVFFTDLETRLYGRDEPGAGELQNLCDRAKELAAVKIARNSRGGADV